MMPLFTNSDVTLIASPRSGHCRHVDSRHVDSLCLALRELFSLRMSLARSSARAKFDRSLEVSQFGVDGQLPCSGLDLTVTPERPCCWVIWPQKLFHCRERSNEWLRNLRLTAQFDPIVGFIGFYRCMPKLSKPAT